ncbi:hypothetical protein JCM8097_002883 [Rhodosporidiobolus ruineniae]
MRSSLASAPPSPSDLAKDAHAIIDVLADVFAKLRVLFLAAADPSSTGGKKAAGLVPGRVLEGLKLYLVWAYSGIGRQDGKPGGLLSQDHWLAIGRPQLVSAAKRDAVTNTTDLSAVLAVPTAALPQDTTWPLGYADSLLDLAEEAIIVLTSPTLLPTLLKEFVMYLPAAAALHADCAGTSEIGSLNCSLGGKRGGGWGGKATNSLANFYARQATGEASYVTRLSKGPTNMVGGIENWNKHATDEHKQAQQAKAVITRTLSSHLTPDPEQPNLTKLRDGKLRLTAGSNGCILYYSAGWYGGKPGKQYVPASLALLKGQGHLWYRMTFSNLNNLHAFLLTLRRNDPHLPTGILGLAPSMPR